MSTKTASEKKKAMHAKKSTTSKSSAQASTKTLTELQQELHEKNEKLMRAYADIQNLQKRMEKDLQHSIEEIRKKYLSELIDHYELLQKAYNDRNPKEGLKAILHKYEVLFEKENITEIECVGKPFDHTCHHAISAVEKDDCDEGVIIDEVKKGYMMGDTFLRPSQVIVAKKKKGDV